jgi:capsular exopolysaccharide synthesis family protein
VPPLATVRFVKPEKGIAEKVPLLIDATMKRGDQLTEAMRLLRTNVGFLTMGGPAVLCVSSAVPGEGKSTITANLALAEAQAGKRVAVLDCDLRKPGLHPLFGLANDQGLSTFLAQGSGSGEPEFQEGPLGIKVLTAGPVPPNPTELLGAQRMIDFIARLRSQVDVVLLDSAPILHLADTLVLQPHINGTILIVNVQSTGTKVLRRIFTALEQASGRVLGVVLNKDRGRVGAYGYGYSYGYGYGYGPRGRESATPLPVVVDASPGRSIVTANGAGKTRALVPQDRED